MMVTAYPDLPAAFATGRQVQTWRSAGGAASRLQPPEENRRQWLEPRYRSSPSDFVQAGSNHVRGARRQIAAREEPGLRRLQQLRASQAEEGLPEAGVGERPDPGLRPVESSGCASDARRRRSPLPAFPRPTWRLRSLPGGSSAAPCDPLEGPSRSVSPAVSRRPRKTSRWSVGSDESQGPLRPPW